MMLVRRKSHAKRGAKCFGLSSRILDDTEHRHFAKLQLLEKIIHRHAPSGHGRFGVGGISSAEDDRVVGIASLIGFDHVLAH